MPDPPTSALKARRTVLVSGASRGIGATIARSLAGAGARVWLGARSLAGCEEIATEIRAENGEAHALELDVTDASSVARALERIGADGVDWLVNNAGIAESAPLLPRAGREAESEELFRRHHEVNLHGPRRLVEAFVPGMLARGYGRVINVASSAALHGSAYIAAYASSKFALLGYTLCAAAELSGKGVTFHAVCPHYVASPMLEISIRRLIEKTGRTEGEAREFFRQQNPGGRIVTPAEVAACVLDLLERDETGLVVELDGSPVAHVHRPNEIVASTKEASS